MMLESRRKRHRICPQIDMLHQRIHNPRRQRRRRRREFVPLVLLSLSFWRHSTASACAVAAAFAVNRNNNKRLVSFYHYTIHKSNANDASDAEDALIVSDGTLLTAETFQERYSSVLPTWLLDRCANEMGWKYPTRIQQQALDAILFHKNDCIIQAETGSGKTLCYLLPCMAAVDPSRSAVQALIVVPTRELGLQVARVAKRLAAASIMRNQSENSHNEDDNHEDRNKSSIQKKIMIMSVLQGSQNRRQRAWAWAEPPHIVIGTPQEISNMVRLGGIKRYNSVKMVIVDEVDACLLNNAGSLSASLMSSSVLHELLSKHLSPTYDDGTSSIQSGIDGVVASLSSSSSSSSSSNKNSARPLSQQRQTIFCSATIPQPRHFAKQCRQNQWMLREPVYVCLRPGEQLMPLSLDHSYMVCSGSDQKMASLRRIVQKLLAKQQQQSSTSMKVLIFAEPQRPLEEMARILASDVPAGLYWKEDSSSSSSSTASPDAIFSVLRYEDSLSQRAAAMDAFRGDDYRSMTTTSVTTFTNHRHLEENTKQVSPLSSDSSSAAPATSGKPLRVMFSTDLAARGLDILDITHVIHFDLPPDADTYVHRAGRSGRFGRSGHVVSIVTSEQEFVLQRLANKMSIDMRCLARQKTAPPAKGKVMED